MIRSCKIIQQKQYNLEFMMEPHSFQEISIVTINLIVQLKYSKFSLIQFTLSHRITLFFCSISVNYSLRNCKLIKQ